MRVQIGATNFSLKDGSEINLFINSNAILNRDTLWSIQGKKRYLQAAIVGGSFLSRNKDMSTNFLSILCHRFARMA